jgi:hypothetical protein
LDIATPPVEYMQQYSESDVKVYVIWQQKECIPLDPIVQAK